MFHWSLRQTDLQKNEKNSVGKAMGVGCDGIDCWISCVLGVEHNDLRSPLVGWIGFLGSFVDWSILQRNDEFGFYLEK